MERLAIQRVEVEDPRWLEFVQLHPRALIFHHPSWINLIAESYGFQKFVLAAIGEKGQLQGGLPVSEINSWLTGRRMVSLPFTDYCPPLVSEENVISALTEYLIAYSRDTKATSCEVRWELPENQGITQLNAFTLHHLGLSTDYGLILQNMKKGHRYNIRQAEKSGLQIRRITTLAEMQEFYRLQLITRRRLGVPAQPRKFFDRLWDNILAKGLGFVSLVYYQSQPVAGAVFFIYQKTITYKYSASDDRYWDLYPNNLLLWDAIKWACQNGYLTFDFGNSPVDNKGLRNFKQGWGTVEQPLIYSYIGKKIPARQTGTLNRAMTAVIKHSPVVVCRLAGQLLYGHFG
jgi:CelD/BcsL family acetyltransferase involved in cellulose biosynthesis